MALGIPKPRPAKLDRADRRASLKVRDEQESAKARTRANGRCEIDVIGEGRCARRDLHTHHMLGGWGRRLSPEGVKAIRKQRTCHQCHSDIGAHVLVREGDPLPHYTDRYRRVR